VSRFPTGDDDTPRTSVTSPGTSDRPAVLMLDGPYEGEDQKERDLMEAFAKRFATVKCFESAATASPGGSSECCPHTVCTAPTWARCPTLEATQGQIDGFFSQLPCKYHQNRVAYVGD